MNEPIPKWMPDGNTAALNKFHSWQDRKIEPTKEDIENFVDEWIEKKRKSLGNEFVYEAVGESDVSRLFQSLDDAHELGCELQRLIRKYWEPQAEFAAESHDWNEEYRERNE